MLAKLCIVIMAVTLTAASMLTVRQQRLDAVYDMVRLSEPRLTIANCRKSESISPGV
ncbi:MAG: hypothetical protein ACFHWZ_12240 [Phycisphaerales bacterium]